MDKQLIDRYITLPMAINVMKQDREKFKEFKMRNVYFDLLDAAIEKASQDFYELKKNMISEYHMDIRRIGKTVYSVNGVVIEYTAEVLKEKTNDLMKHYISVVEIEWEVWE